MLNCIKKGAEIRVTEVPIKERGRLQSLRLKSMQKTTPRWLKPKVCRSCGMAESRALPRFDPVLNVHRARSNACMVVRIVEIALSLPTAVLIIM
jgi:hypothetical protein